MEAAREKRPFFLWLYLALTSLSFGLVFAPSSVHTEYAWWALPLWAICLAGLVLRADLARKLLILGGIGAALGDMVVQAPPLDAVATVRAAITLIGVAILVMPAARRYTWRSWRDLTAKTPTTT